MSNIYLSYIMARTSYIRWDYDDVRFVLDQHNELNFYSVSSLKEQSAGKHVAPLEHEYTVFEQINLSFLFHTSDKQQITII